MSDIYFARHGDYRNPSHIIPFRYPRITLSSYGEVQIEHNGVFFKDKNIKAIYTSPIVRTVETAHILSQALDIPYIEDRRLIEVESPYQGVAKVLFHDRVANLYTDEYHVKGWGETVEQVHNRVSAAIRHIKQYHAGENVIVVSHGDPIMIYSLFERGASYYHYSLFKHFKYIPMGGILKHSYNKQGKFVGFEEINY